MRAQGGRREQRALASACIANAYQTEAVVPSLISVEMRPQHGRPTYQGKVAAVAPSNHARGLRFTSCKRREQQHTSRPLLDPTLPNGNTLPHIGSTNPGSSQ